MRHDAFSSLIDYRIRNAWLFNLYLDQQNSEAVAKGLYIRPVSSNSLVQTTLYRQLQRAARSELLKSRSFISEKELYLDAEVAFLALSNLLGDDTHFFGGITPTLFDASVFAYTHLLLDESMNWQNTVLAESLMKMGNLVQHRQRLLESYFKVQCSSVEAAHV
jgi:metaxin